MYHLFLTLVLECYSWFTSPCHCSTATAAPSKTEAPKTIVYELAVRAKLGEGSLPLLSGQLQKIRRSLGVNSTLSAYHP
jgi:hypothetical protein